MQKQRDEAKRISSLITTQANGIKERYLKRRKYTDSYQNKAHNYKHIKYKMVIGLKLNFVVLGAAHRALSVLGKHFTTMQQHPVELSISFLNKN